MRVYKRRKFVVSVFAVSCVFAVFASLSYSNTQASLDSIDFEWRRFDAGFRSWVMETGYKAVPANRASVIGNPFSTVGFDAYGKLTFVDSDWLETERFLPEFTQGHAVYALKSGDGERGLVSVAGALNRVLLADQLFMVMIFLMITPLAVYVLVVMLVEIQFAMKATAGVAKKAANATVDGIYEEHQSRVVKAKEKVERESQD